MESELDDITCSLKRLMPAKDANGSGSKICFRVSERQAEAIVKCAWDANVDVAKLVRASITIGIPILIDNEDSYSDEEQEKLTENISLQLEPKLERALRKTLIHHSTWKAASIIRSSLRLALPLMRAYPAVIGHFNLKFLDVSNLLAILGNAENAEAHPGG